MSDPNDRWKRFVFNGQRAQRAVDAILEDDFQAQVEQYAAVCGWLCYHTRDSRGSVPGFPDLVLLRARKPGEDSTEKVRMVVAELKSEDGDVTPAQQVWLEYFQGAGAETYIWRPSNFEGMTRVLR